jgi:predicted HicB family RNase H-like nuclease
METTETVEERCRKVEEKADQLFAAGVAWTTFFKELLGPEGLVRQLFPTPEELTRFEQTATHRKVQEMLAGLRRVQEGRAAKTEAVSVITLRIPKSLHDALAEEAHALKTSINRLCISKLAQLIDARLVPPLRQFERRGEITVQDRGERSQTSDGLPERE